MTRILNLAIVVSFLTFAACPATAQFSLSTTPASGILPVGQAMRYTVASTDSNYVVGDVQWTYWETSPNVTPPYSMSGGASVTTNEYYIGKYTVQAVVSSGSTSSPNPPPPVTRTLRCFVTILPPDDFIMPTPATTLVPVRGQKIYVFTLTAQGSPVGQLSGKVLENITNERFLSQKRPSRTGVGALQYLSISGNAILDTKFFKSFNQQGYTQYVTFPKGMSLWSYNQQFVIYLKDLAGVNQEITLQRIFSVKGVVEDGSTVSWTVQ